MVKKSRSAQTVHWQLQKKNGTSAVTGSIKVPPSWSGYEGMEIIFFNLSIHSNFLQRKELIKEKWDIHRKQGNVNLDFYQED